MYVLVTLPEADEQTWWTNSQAGISVFLNVPFTYLTILTQFVVRNVNCQKLSFTMNLGWIFKSFSSIFSTLIFSRKLHDFTLCSWMSLRHHQLIWIFDLTSHHEAEFCSRQYWHVFFYNTLTIFGTVRVPTATLHWLALELLFGSIKQQFHF